MQILDIIPSRPPCSHAERDMAVVVQRRLRAYGWRPTTELFRASTSPTWPPLLRALLRVWGAAFLAAAWPAVAIGLGIASVLATSRLLAGAIRFLPLLGATSRNVVAVRRGRDRALRPIVVVAHLDTHPTSGEPVRRAHSAISVLSGWALVVSGIVAYSAAGPRAVAAFVAAESVFTLAWLARNELATPTEPQDDNTSGLLALERLAELAGDGSQLRDVCLVATGAGTSGNQGMRSFLRKHRELREAWVIEIDALGVGEVVAAPCPARFPFAGSPPSLVRSVVTAARRTGDPLAVKRVTRPHSDAAAALRRRTPAVALTAGLRPPAGVREGPDPANAERAARIVDELARFDADA